MAEEEKDTATTTPKKSVAVHRSKTSKYRNIVIFVVLVLVTIGYCAYVPLGNLSGFGWDWVSFICPLGALEAWLASWTVVPRSVISFIIIVILIILFGRFFCSWICPMPLLQIWHPGKRKEQQKMAAEIAAAKERGAVDAHTAAGGNCAACSSTLCGKKANNFKFDSRHVVLLGALASTAIFGFPVFCLVCPIGLTFATIYLVLHLFNVMGLLAGAEVTITILIAPLILFIEVVFLRKWCSKICPVGAFISLVAGANKTVRPTVDNKKCLVTDKGVNCTVCHNACPVGIDPRRPELSEVSLNNCTKCRECADACPTKAIHFPFFSKQTKAPECDPEFTEE
jgi:ferredoxin-type protein NapH